MSSFELKLEQQFALSAVKELAKNVDREKLEEMVVELTRQRMILRNAFAAEIKKDFS